MAGLLLSIPVGKAMAKGVGRRKELEGNRGLQQVGASKRLADTGKVPALRRL